MSDPRRAYRVVDDFEQELCDYTGARFACAVDSCTNAIFLSLAYSKIISSADEVALPARTYPGVAHAVRNAGYDLEIRAELFGDWQGSGRYTLHPTRVVDAARTFGRNCYRTGHLQCHSFHVGKQMPSGGGAILCDDEAAYRWLQRAKNDGRAPGESFSSGPGWHMGMVPPDAARGLWMLPQLPDQLTPLRHEHGYPDLRDMTWA